MAKKAALPSAKLVQKVYDDAASKSVRVIGDQLAEAVTTALRPVGGVIWTVDRAFDWVRDRVVHRLSRERGNDRLIRPTPELEARVIQAIQTAGPSEEPLLRNMFAGLLSTALLGADDSASHVSFAEVLRQLDARDAVILSYVSSAPATLLAVSTALQWCRIEPGPPERVEWLEDAMTQKHQGRFEWRPLEEDLKSHRVSPFHLQNLMRLGVIEEQRVTEWNRFGPGVRHGGHARVEIEKLVKKHGRRASSLSRFYGTVAFIPRRFDAQVISLTRWGQSFASAVAASEFWNNEAGTPTMPEWAA